jgi:hypothetical protein
MCWMCDHPNATRRDYLDHMLDLIARYGWAVQGVGRDGPHPPWAYTVGLTEAGHPELVVTGISASRATDLLNDVASHAIHAETPMKAGERVALIGGPTIELVEMAATSARLVTAIDIYGRGLRALQLVHADDRGHWPWEVGYRGRQTVLGIRASSGPAAA